MAIQRKTQLRRAILERRDSLSSQDIRRHSEAAGSRLLALAELAAARLVMFFVSFGSEVETRPTIRRALAEGKRVAAPRADPAGRTLTPCEIRDVDRDLHPGAHNIPEPRADCPAVDLHAIDVVIVPAVVWAEDGYRVGYGAGYYDRFLERVEGAVWVGLGLEMQVVPEVPHGPRDLPVHLLVTEARVRRFRRGAAGGEDPNT